MPEGKLPPIRRFKFISPDFFKPWAIRCWRGAISPGPISSRSGRWSWCPRIWRASYGADPRAALGKRIRENPKGDLARDRRRGRR